MFSTIRTSALQEKETHSGRSSYLGTPLLPTMDEFPGKLQLGRGGQFLIIIFLWRLFYNDALFDRETLSKQAPNTRTSKYFE